MSTTNVTDSLKKRAAELIELSKAKLGSYEAVSNKCGISAATINLVRSGKYEVDGTDMYRKIINALEVFEDNWVIVETTNYRKCAMVMKDAREKCMFMSISSNAGSGKTVAAKLFVHNDKSNASYYIKCRKWGNRVFLMNLLRTLGLNPESKYASNDDLLEQVIEFFKMRVDKKPLLIIDQANSLRGSAFTNIIIHLFNELEGQMGLVAYGTENLEKEIKRGVKYGKDGYDETDSRLGRNFIALPGFTYNDTASMCQANGVKDKQVIDDIFSECRPVKKMYNNRVVTLVLDGRRIKRCIQREILKAS